MKIGSIFGAVLSEILFFLCKIIWSGGLLLRDFKTSMCVVHFSFIILSSITSLMRVYRLACHWCVHSTQCHHFVLTSFVHWNHSWETSPVVSPCALGGHCSCGAVVKSFKEFFHPHCKKFCFICCTFPVGMILRTERRLFQILPGFAYFGHGHM